jgi:drug/metabolite transporter (DMT)-like permease
LKRPRTVIVVLFLVQAFFATLPVAGKIALRELTTPALVVVRVGIAAIIFYAIHKLTTNERIRSKADYARIALYSLLGVSLNQLLYLLGLSMTTATAAQMLIVAGPAVTLLVAIVLGKELGTPKKWLAIALAAAGALALIGAVPAGGRIGNLIILVNVITYSTYLVIARGILRQYHPLTVITWVFIFGALALAPIGLPAAFAQFGNTSLHTRLALAWIILFPTVGAYYLNMWALLHVESSLVSTFVYVQPIMTAALAVSILHEKLSLRLIPAALLISAGVAVAIHENRAGHGKPSPADQTIVEA